jgi:hypothetical protein
MFRRLLGKLLMNALVKAVCAVLRPVPVLGTAAQIIAFAM